MLKVGTGRAFLIIGGAAFGLVVCELALRAVGFSSPVFFRSDVDTGYSLREGTEGWWRSEGEAYITINSAGLRDREHSKSKLPSTFRIAVLGDSYAEAMQVPMEAAFWRVLEPNLQACPAFHARQIEVINFGVGGYGTAQEILTLRHRAWAYSPDLVLLAFLSGNDVRNNVRSLEGDPMRPYFVYKDDALVLDTSFRQLPGFRFRQSIMRNGGYWLLDHLRTLQLLREPRRFIKGGENSQPQSEVGLDVTVYVEPVDPVWKEAWRVTEGLIVQMRNEVREKGADFIVVTLTNGDQVGPDPRERRTYAQRLGVPDLLYPERRIKSLGDREGIPVLTLAQPFAAYAEEHTVFLHGFENEGRGHWNAKGHHLAGTLIAEKICSDSAARVSLKN